MFWISILILANNIWFRSSIRNIFGSWTSIFQVSDNYFWNPILFIIIYLCISFFPWISFPITRLISKCDLIVGITSWKDLYFCHLRTLSPRNEKKHFFHDTIISFLSMIDWVLSKFDHKKIQSYLFHYLYQIWFIYVRNCIICILICYWLWSFYSLPAYEDKNFKTHKYILSFNLFKSLSR